MKSYIFCLLAFYICIPGVCRGAGQSIDFNQLIDEYNSIKLDDVANLGFLARQKAIEKKSAIQREIQGLGAVAVPPLAYVYQHAVAGSPRQVTALSELGSLAPLVSDQTFSDPKKWKTIRDGLELFFQNTLGEISKRSPLTAADLTMINDAAHGLEGLHSLSPTTTAALNAALAKVNSAPESAEKDLAVGTINLMKFSLQQWPAEQTAIMNPPDPSKLPPIPDSLLKPPAPGQPIRPPGSFTVPDNRYALTHEASHPSYPFDPMLHQPENQVLPGDLPVYDPAIPPETSH